MRWLAAVILAVLVSVVTLALLGAVGIYEIGFVFAAALALAWLVVVRPAGKNDD